ncbi:MULTISPECIES: glucose 1-dehydrogenase [Planococcus]|uniref:Oxidoreductase n=2 Tax=Planococcus TaxID=1372 RepID=A0ABM5WWK7_9BACL|nr:MULTISPECIES: glucose 1-dehydrogenase [Planococcus]ALS78737.1 oxidoreductase [Planococcus kocurii]AQU79303.1 oxidoreductase [Planococcus faecalis]KAA0955182.1 glucose 1-dehydrogenase [Planococcus sp. ANT_H30]MDJ0333513.1 glucose 1-dehydrogenase [Planococcus sp. S3-L1]
MTDRLKGKIAVITGAAGDLGAAAAEIFLKEGAKVVLIDRDQQKLTESREYLSQFGELFSIIADVTSEKEVADYVDEVVKRWGRIDVFLNNAGILGRVAPLVEQSVKDFDLIMNINVKGVFLGLKKVLPIMIEQKSGSIINTSSVSGLMGSGGNSLYAASKHAVVGLTKTAALEAGHQSVRVNSIHPAPLDSTMMRKNEEGINSDNPSEVRERISSRIPLGRYGSTSEVAKLLLFLASDDSEFITGSQYRIDGGMGAR